MARTKTQRQIAARGIAARVLQIRAAAGLSAHELDVKAGVGRNTTARVEAGASVPRADTLVRLARALGVELGWLADGKAVAP